MSGGYRSIAAPGSKTTNQGHKLLMHIRERLTFAFVFLVCQSYSINKRHSLFQLLLFFFFQISHNKLGVLISNAPGKTVYSL